MKDDMTDERGTTTGGPGPSNSNGAGGPHGARTTGRAVRENYWQAKIECEKKGIKLFTQTIFYDWCKACGICAAFCPKQVFRLHEKGKPLVERPDACIGCLFCEMHCPDFAITISDRYPERRHKRREEAREDGLE